MEKLYKSFQEIKDDHSEERTWAVLDKGYLIKTLSFSEKNVQILQELLQSFTEHYGEIIGEKEAREELALYHNKGKLFVYCLPDGKVISMNGCVYDEDNETVDFLSADDRPLHSIYFYGLSTLPDHRGHGACRNLVKFAIEYARSLGYDYVYARTDLKGSMSESIMHKEGLNVCTIDDSIIVEPVQVTPELSDNRLHMWLPLKQDLYIMPKGDPLYANNDSERLIIQEPGKSLIKTSNTQTH